ncbi:sensor histidine kinase [Aureibacter tunicatorum]|uniref:histidine kinase n=1 Tax=Aureibacter tunicatorum TaxID=866807 RepID=A0AAE4BUB1_9BACT|nr:HAMP domain-containing sensor histidine kinase [Aureibacter tunicatorum]MDR6240583.1 signal transduction histidine kinase [Aureibacter tunicatorum]BDD06556.1 two-component sensor histidine kinase [Aureibacter tunicatorum]
MKKKTTTLILLAGTILLALSFIQAYLLYNSYQLEKRIFEKESHNILSPLYDMPKLDSLHDEFRDTVRCELVQLKNGKRTIEVLQERVIKIAKHFDTRTDLIINEYLDNNDFDYSLELSRTLEGIVVFDNDEIDSVFTSDVENPLIVYGSMKAVENGTVINSTKTSTSGDDIHFELTYKDYKWINDQNSIVFRRLSGMLVITALIYLFVIGLAVYAIRALIEEKRVVKTKTDFINNITHELKTPLATLGVASKSLKNPKLLENSQMLENTLGIMDRQNERLQRLFDQVMHNDFSDLHLSRKTSLNETFLRELIGDFKLGAEDKIERLELQVTLDNTGFNIDRFHFSTALLNILENAVKYSDKKAEIDILAMSTEREILISVADRGKGISKADANHIFDKYFRASQANRHDVKGLGLGLFYTRHIIEAHGGSIRVESKLHEGTKFLIKLPIEI